MNPCCQTNIYIHHFQVHSLSHYNIRLSLHQYHSLFPRFQFNIMTINSVLINKLTWPLPRLVNINQCCINLCHWWPVMLYIPGDMPCWSHNLKLNNNFFYLNFVEFYTQIQEITEGWFVAINAMASLHSMPAFKLSCPKKWTS